MSLSIDVELDEVAIANELYEALSQVDDLPQCIEDLGSWPVPNRSEARWLLNELIDTIVETMGVST